MLFWEIIAQTWKDTNLPNLEYFAHALQLVVCDGMLSQRTVIDVLTICDRACKNRTCGHKLYPVSYQVISHTRSYLSTGEEYLHSVTCIIKPIKCLLRPKNCIAIA